jgi:hypothetical protein
MRPGRAQKSFSAGIRCIRKIPNGWSTPVRASRLTGADGAFVISTAPLGAAFMCDLACCRKNSIRSRQRTREVSVVHHPSWAEWRLPWCANKRRFTLWLCQGRALGRINVQTSDLARCRASSLIVGSLRAPGSRISPEKRATQKLRLVGPSDSPDYLHRLACKVKSRSLQMSNASPYPPRAHAAFSRPSARGTVIGLTRSCLPIGAALNPSPDAVHEAVDKWRPPL